MLKPLCGCFSLQNVFQPPLGGCVLKLWKTVWVLSFKAQPPLGGCVLKRITVKISDDVAFQPPLGGCVLKLRESQPGRTNPVSAAFRRLCVETSSCLTG